MHIVPLNNYVQLIPTVGEWLYNEWGMHSPGGSIERAKASLRELPDDSGLPYSLIALRGEVPIGVARIVRLDMYIRPMLSPWLASVYVHPEFRKSGIGTSLCRSIVNYAESKDFNQIFLFTPDRASFYSYQGWELYETTVYQEKEVTIMKFIIGEQTVYA